MLCVVIWGQMVRPDETWMDLRDIRGRIGRIWVLAELMVLRASRMTVQAPVLTVALALGMPGCSAATGIVGAQQGGEGSPLS